MRSIATRLTLIVAIPLMFAACASQPKPSVDPTPVATSPPAPTATPNTHSLDPTASHSTPQSLHGQIVFEDAGQDFQYSQIWIENADGSNVRKIVSDDLTDNGPSLSPDGGRVVFYQAGAASFEDALADPNLFGRIMLVNVDGSRLHELKTGNRTNRCDAGPEGNAWSPDGRRIVFNRACFDRSMSFVGSSVWTISADGTDAREVIRTGPAKYLGNETWAAHLEDHRASWSPDGKRLVFQRIDTSTTPERSAIFTIGINGKGLRQVTPWKLDANDAVWSPDGGAIAFNSPAEPAREQNIYTIRPDGTGLTKLTRYSEDGQATFHPSWSPDGAQILFSHSPSTDGWGDFFVMNRDGSDQHIIAATAIHENHGYWGPSPSP
jgi:Tol biopolymer transport system component